MSHTPKANARLIAAAPELLEALKELTRQIRMSKAVDDHGHRLENLKALIDAEVLIAKVERAASPGPGRARRNNTEPTVTAEHQNKLNPTGEQS